MCPNLSPQVLAGHMTFPSLTLQLIVGMLNSGQLNKQKLHAAALGNHSIINFFDPLSILLPVGWNKGLRAGALAATL